MKKKSLSDMTLEELWTLFPIVLTSHQDSWTEWYRQESQRIQNFLGEEEFRFSHIGSTSISGIWAKPIVDMLLEVPAGVFMEAVKEKLLLCGYRCICEEKDRKDFNRGYTEEGFAEQVFHLHLRCLGDNDELYFRDYMNEHPQLAKQYEELKLSLWKKYEHDRDGYTNAKGEFIRQQTVRARLRYGTRYDGIQDAAVRSVET